MERLINNLRLFAEEVDRGVYEVDDETAMTVASLLVVMYKVLEEVDMGDRELLAVFASHLIDFIQLHNADKENDKLVDIERLNKLLEDVNLD